MAIAPTGDIYKALEFDGESSRSYGVYITGEAVYNAPERDVEMISIPGRNGSYALDKGRFQNIEVTYPAGIFADNETDFRNAISDFRNFLCSRNGYVRLTDEYNPNEYRMAVYKSGLEVDPTMLKAGEFNITFECKPQRWLTDGETKTTISTSGDTITNLTLFDSSPLLEVEGDGTIELNGYTIELENEFMGEILLANSGDQLLQTPYNLSFAQGYVNNGDSIWFDFKTATTHDLQFYCGSMQYSGTLSYTDSNADVSDIHSGGFSWDKPTFIVGTAKTITNTRTYTTDAYPLEQATLTGTVVYDGANTFTFSATIVSSAHIDLEYSMKRHVIWGNLNANSTVLVLGHPTYIDCDLGYAYKIVNDEIISLNPYIDLGSDLPKLASGSNTVTFDNTITDLKIVPRWWKV